MSTRRGGRSRRLRVCQYDLESERSRCLQLIDELAARRLDDDWPPHPAFGRMTGPEVSRLHAKHLNHHLTQFGV